MIASVQKWGNSLGIRIPKKMLDSVSMHENDKVNLEQVGDSISIRKITPAHRTLEERLVAYYGKPIESIAAAESEEEFDWGVPEGSEIW